MSRFCRSPGGSAPSLPSKKSTCASKRQRTPLARFRPSQKLERGAPPSREAACGARARPQAAQASASLPIHLSIYLSSIYLSAKRRARRPPTPRRSQTGHVVSTGAGAVSAARSSASGCSRAWEGGRGLGRASASVGPRRVARGRRSLLPLAGGAAPAQRARQAPSGTEGAARRHGPAPPASRASPEGQGRGLRRSSLGRAGLWGPLRREHARVALQDAGVLGAHLGRLLAAQQLDQHRVAALDVRRRVQVRQDGARVPRRRRDRLRLGAVARAERAPQHLHLLPRRVGRQELVHLRRWGEGGRVSKRRGRSVACGSLGTARSQPRRLRQSPGHGRDLAVSSQRWGPVEQNGCQQPRPCPLSRQRRGRPAHAGGRPPSGAVCAHLLGELEPLELHIVGGPRGHER